MAPASAYRRGAATRYLVPSPWPSSCLVLRGRRIPLVFSATDEPIFFLRFVLTASCARAQQQRLPLGAAMQGCPHIFKKAIFTMFQPPPPFTSSSGSIKRR